MRDTINIQTLKTVYDSLPCGVALFEDSEQKKIIYMNPFFCRLLHADPEDDISAYDVISKEHREIADRDFALLNSQETVPFERTLHTFDGSIKYISGYLSRCPLFGEEYEKKLILTTFNDITDEKIILINQERDYERYRLLMEHIGFSVIDFNMITGEIYLSPNMSLYDFQIDSSSRSAVIRRFGESCVHPEDKRAFEIFSRDFRNTDKKEVTLRLKRMDGMYRFVRLMFSRIRDNNNRPLRDLVTIQDIDDQIRAQKENSISRQRLDNVLSVIPVGIYIQQISPEFKPIYVSEQAKDMLGYSDSELQKILNVSGKGLSKIKWTDFPPHAEKDFYANRNAEGLTRIELDGEVRWLKMISKKVNGLAEGEHYCYICIVDITKQHLQEELLKRQEERYRLLSENCEATTYDYNVLKDKFVSSMMVHGERYERLLSPFSESREQSYLREPLSKIFREIIEEKSNLNHEDEMFIATENGQRWFKNTCVGIQDERGEIVRIVGRLDDIHEMKVNQMRLKMQATIDPLTGILNRSEFMKIVRKNLSILKNQEYGCFAAFILLDIDCFKEVNDKYGHVFGDKVIQSFGRKMNIFCSKLPNPSFCARFGGDEFFLFITEIMSRDELIQILSSLTEELCVQVGERNVSVSIGCSIYPQDGLTIAELYKLSDRAMYCAKALGGKAYTLAQDSSYPESTPLEQAIP